MDIPAGVASGTAPTLNDVLGSIRMAVAQMRLYPLESPQVAKVAGAVHQTLAAHLGDASELIVAGAPEGLLVGGKRFMANDATGASLETFFRATLQECRIRSLRLPRGAEPAELTTFLHALAQKFWDVQDGKEINRRLREAGVTRITIDEVEYVEVGKSDLLIKEGATALEQEGYSTDEFLQTLDERIEWAADRGGAHEMRRAILRKLLGQDPTLIRGEPEEDASAGLLRHAQGVLPFEQAREIVERLSKIQGQCPPEAQQALREATAQLLEGFRSHRRLAGAMKKALGGAAGLAPEWISQASGGDADEAVIQRTRALLALSPGVQAEALAREGEGLVAELIRMGRTDMADSVLDLLVASLGNASIVRRRLASETVLSLGKLLETEALAKFREDLEARVRTALDEEKDPRTYTKFAELAGFLAESRLKKGEMNQALRLLDVLKRHSVLKDAVFPERSQLVLAALEKVTSGEAYKSIAASLKPKDDAADRLQQAMDVAAIRFLIAEMKGIESLAERLRVGQPILKTGDAAAVTLAEEVRKTKFPSEALRLLEVLPALVPAGLVGETLEKLIVEHPVASVRRRAAILMAEKGVPRAEEVLTTAFSTATDPTVRGSLADALGRLRGAEAVRLLLEAAMSRHERDEVRIACCTALGKTGETAVIPSLVELASRPAGGLTRIFKSTPVSVRAAALKSLGHFLPDPTAQQTILRAAADPDPAVQAAAREAATVKPAPAREPSVDAGPDQGGLAGSLKEMPLDHLCRTLAMGGRTGALRIRTRDAEGSIHFKDGSIVRIDFRDKQGQEAFNGLARLANGLFIFKAGVPCPNPGPPLQVEPLLLEAFRVADEHLIQ